MHFRPKKKSKVKENIIASPTYTRYLEHVYDGRRKEGKMDTGQSKSDGMTSIAKQFFWAKK